MKIKLKALSPLHIGGREGVIYPSELLTFEGRCYIISEDRLSHKLFDRGKLDAFLEHAGERLEIESFLQTEGLLERDFLEEVSEYSSECPVMIRRELRPFVRNAFSQPFIPGSSIKGVLRTSIMYVILKRLDQRDRRRLLDDFVMRRLKEYKEDPRGQRGHRWFQQNFKKTFAQRLDQDVFQRFILKEGRSRNDAHSDVLRYLKISDSDPVDKDGLRVEEIKVYSARSPESPKRWSIFAECVPAGVEFEFEMKIDKGILQDFARKNSFTRLGMSFSELSQILLNPLAAAEEMAADLLQEEREFFDQELGIVEAMDFGEEPNFRIGWGAGLLGTSLGMLLPEAIRRELRNALFRDCGNTPAPKSRRVVVGNGALGWCKLIQEG